MVSWVSQLQETAQQGDWSTVAQTLQQRYHTGGWTQLSVDEIASLVSLAIAGSGDISATGRCGAGTAKIAGSGDMKLDGLKCATLSASIAGSGNIRVVATQTANLSMIGSGDITLTGGARCTVSSAGSGKARCS